MALFSIPHVRIAGLAGAVPRTFRKTLDYSWISLRERQQLIQNVGVEQRRVAEKGMTTADLCYVAARQLIASLNWDAGSIDLLVFISQSGDYLVPPTSCILQDRLGLLKSCIAYDIGMGCSGYVYGLSAVGSMIATGAVKRTLMMVGDISTLTTSYKDKSSYPLFGDAGTATALEYSGEAPPLVFNLQTDGSGYQAIIIRDGRARHNLSRKSFGMKKISKGIIRSKLNLELDGIKIFNFSLREVVPNIKALLKHTGTELQDIDYIVFHQANKLINETLRKMLKAEKEKVPSSIQLYGNTSSASIPLTMITELRQQLSTGKQRLLLSAFGVGLSWGSVLLETDSIVCPEIMEY
ncbi:MAG: ketoacyl-ACP synthase III [Bacteroidales bacterium]|nr:ketoacyl-ACP synthase III [Bacteroidales bacterium]